MRPHHLRQATLIALALGLLACSATPDKKLGLRPGYEQLAVKRVAIVPFYSTGTFGLEDDKLKATISAYERACAEWLINQGFQVLKPEEFRAHLERRSVWKEFQDGVELSLPLWRYFEPGADPTNQTTEVVTLRKLAQAKALPTKTVLVGEIVYQTETTCTQSADGSNTHASVVVSPSAPDDYPRPCIVSHFQAKLVDTDRGDTIWYSRKLREYHDAKLDDGKRQANISEVVALTLGGPYGLDVLSSASASAPR